MTKGRVEAFSDGVIAIIITIMVLELKVPDHHDLAALGPLFPVLLSYVLSFANVGIYWNNHHHMFHAVQHVGGRVLWANLHLLFWLSLMPFATAFMGESTFAGVPLAIYDIDLLMCAAAYFLLERALIAQHGRTSAFASALSHSWKDMASPLLYLIALPLAFVWNWGALALIVGVSLMWLIPDTRFERSH